MAPRFGDVGTPHPPSLLSGTRLVRLPFHRNVGARRVPVSLTMSGVGSKSRRGGDLPPLCGPFILRVRPTPAASSRLFQASVGTPRGSDSRAHYGVVTDCSPAA